MLYESLRWGSQGPVDPRLVEDSIKSPDIRDGKPHFYPTSTLHRHTDDSSHQSKARIGTSLLQKTSIPGGILDSAPQPEQRAGVKTLGCPDRATRTPTAARAYAGGFEVCRYRSLPPGEHFPHRVASATLLLASLLDTVPFIFQSTVLSISCRRVELGISSVERCRGFSTLRDVESLRRTSMSVPIENYRHYRESHENNPLSR